MTRVQADGRPSVRRLKWRGSSKGLLYGLLGLILLSVLVLAALAWTRDSGSSAGPGDCRAAGEALRVAPRASGAGDGSSWTDAAELADLPRLIDSLPDGGEVWLRADAGPFTVHGSVRIDSGGTSEAPVVVRGVDEAGRPAQAVLSGDRTAPYRPDGDSGPDVFSLRGGADHLVFRDLVLKDVGNAFLAAGDVDDVTVQDVSATNVRRFFENRRSDDEESADVTDLTLRRITVDGFSKRVLRLRYDSHDILVEDVSGDSQQQDGDDFAIGVHLEGEVHDVTLRRVSMDNTRDTLRDYWNGDGFATERGVDNVRFINTSASGNTDAGYDLKSTRTTLDGAVAGGNKRNFRFWADDTTAQDCQGADPVKRGGSSSQAQVWLGEGAVALLEDCLFEDSSEDSIVFDLESNAELTLTGGRVSHQGQLTRTEQGASVDLP